MSAIVMDASALLALLNSEKGHETVEKYLPDGIMSTINLSEVIAVLCETGIPEEDAQRIVLELIRETVNFDEEQALLTAQLRKKTKTLGLSLGDRACLALGKIRKTKVLTADKSWQKLSDIEVVLIR